jgi:hypothetical protein
VQCVWGLVSSRASRICTLVTRDYKPALIRLKKSCPVLSVLRVMLWRRTEERRHSSTILDFGSTWRSSGQLHIQAACVSLRVGLDATRNRTSALHFVASRYTD